MNRITSDENMSDISLSKSSSQLNLNFELSEEFWENLFSGSNEQNIIPSVPNDFETTKSGAEYLESVLNTPNPTSCSNDNEDDDEVTVYQLEDTSKSDHAESYQVDTEQRERLINQAMTSMTISSDLNDPTLHFPQNDPTVHFTQNTEAQNDYQNPDPCQSFDVSGQSDEVVEEDDSNEDFSVEKIEADIPPISELNNVEDLVSSIIYDDFDIDEEIVNPDTFYLSDLLNSTETTTSSFSPLFALNLFTKVGLQLTSPLASGISESPFVTQEEAKIVEIPEIDLDSTSSSKQVHESQLKELPCLVCGGNAGKHVHYGGQACYSCKAFFRRAVKDDVYKKFNCPSKNCSINSKSWRSCKSCRFQKCLASGLKPNWVLDKTERRRRREKKSTATTTTITTTTTTTTTMTSVHPTEALVHANLCNPVSKASQMIWSYSNDELMQIITLGDTMHRNLTKSLMRFYGRNPTLFGQITKAIYYETLVHYDLYMKWETIWPNTAKELVAKSSGLDTLNQEDKEKLTRYNFPSLQVLFQSVLMINRQDFMTSNMGETIMGSLLRQPPSENNEEDVVKLHDVLRGLNVGMKMPPNALTYEQIFSSPWASRKDLEERHAYIMPKMALWPVDPNDISMRVDKAQLFLIYNIMMLSPDGVQLNDEPRVNKILECHYNMLYRYLTHKYKDEAMSHFMEGILMAKLGREAHDIRTHRLPI